MAPSLPTTVPTALPTPLPTLLFDMVAAKGDAPFLWRKVGDGQFEPMTYAEVGHAVSCLGKALIQRGVQPGDRVVLVSENRPEWLIADFAIMAAGAITVPAYITNTVDDHAHILSNCGARVAIVSTAALAERLLPAAVRASLDFVVAMEVPSTVPQELSVVGWSDLVATGATLDGPERVRSAEVNLDHLACLIYTSGTGGRPKGVMLSHRNLMANIVGARAVVDELNAWGGTPEGGDVFLSFLPLSHAFEHTAGQCLPLAMGAQIYYAGGADTLSQDMAVVRPTLMVAVPRLFEVLHSRILAGVKRASPTKRWLFEKTLSIGTKRYADASSLSLLERVLDPLLSRLVRAKVRERFGGRLRALVSGGAPLNVEIGVAFHALGLPIYQGYGQTEASPIVSCNRPGRVKMHSVGPVLPGVELTIAEDGEILVRGELVMQGYWGDQNATETTLRDGWLHTGDIGVVDADGCIQITDRKKDIIVISGGDNIAPARVEGLLTLEPEIAQAMVHGDKRPYLVAILVADEEVLRRAREEEDPASAVRKALSAAVERVNKRLSQVERVRSFIVADEPFTVDNGLMTPTMKIRRHMVRGQYLSRLEALYEARKAA